MQNITGVFASETAARHAIDRLLQAGCAQQDISLLTAHQNRDKTRPGKHEGLAMGDIVDAVLSGLTAVGNVVVTGGSLLAAGPIFSIFSGADTKQVISGLNGLLLESGFSDEEALSHERDLEAGKTIVIYHPQDAAIAAKAREILT